LGEHIAFDRFLNIARAILATDGRTSDTFVILAEAAEYSMDGSFDRLLTQPGPDGDRVRALAAAVHPWH
jgi:hypothetical protein